MVFVSHGKSSKLYGKGKEIFDNYISSKTAVHVMSP